MKSWLYNLTADNFLAPTPLRSSTAGLWLWKPMAQSLFTPTGDFSDSTALLDWAQKAYFKGLPWQNVTPVTALSQILLFPKSTNATHFETPELKLTAANFNSRIWGLSHLANADYYSHLQRKVLSIERENSYFHTGHWVMVNTFHTGNILCLIQVVNNYVHHANY